MKPIRGACDWGKGVALKKLDLAPFKDELKATILSLCRGASPTAAAGGGGGGAAAAAAGGGEGRARRAAEGVCARERAELAHTQH